jgi:hypothetical protein
VRESVGLRETDSEDRFRALLAVAEVEVVGGPHTDVFARANEQILAVARAVEPRPYAVIVWNGEAGDGPGGTADFVAALARVSGDDRVVVIDPAP